MKSKKVLNDHIIEDCPGHSTCLSTAPASSLSPVFFGGKTMEEIWIDIPGYKGMYNCSSTGKVKEVDSTISVPGEGIYVLEGVELNTETNNCGYLYVNLHKGNSRKHALIHQLVWDCFGSKKRN